MFKLCIVCTSKCTCIWEIILWNNMRRRISITFLRGMVVTSQLCLFGPLMIMLVRISSAPTKANVIPNGNTMWEYESHHQLHIHQVNVHFGLLWKFFIRMNCVTYLLVILPFYITMWLTFFYVWWLSCHEMVFHYALESFLVYMLRGFCMGWIII